MGELPTGPGRSCRQILEDAVSGDVRAVLLMGADPVRDVPDGETARSALAAADLVVAIDLFLTDSSSLADVVLPADGFAEKEGTVTNVEGRVQKVNRVVPGAGQSRPDWSILDDIARRLGVDLGLHSGEGIAKEIAAVAPAYTGVSWEALDWEARDGIVAPLDGPLEGGVQPLRYVPADTPGSLAAADVVLHSARTMYDDGVLMREGLSLHALAPGGALHVHPDDITRLGLAPGGSARITTEADSAILPVVADPSLGHGVVYVPFNQPGVPALGSAPEVEVVPA